MAPEARRAVPEEERAVPEEGRAAPEGDRTPEEEATRVVLLVGTRKGLFRLSSDRRRRDWRLEGPHLAGHEVYHALLDPRRPRVGWASTHHRVWGAHLHRSEDAGGSWTQLEARPRFDTARNGGGSGSGLRAVWHLAPGPPERPDRLHAGTEPAALFRSEDGGGSWQRLEGLERHPTRRAWQSARGGLALHSVQTDPRDPDRLYVAVSAGGCYRSDDGGESWKPLNRGIRADYLPDPEAALAGHCTHSLRLHPARPDRLYRQEHAGCYRSDDRGERWTEITGGLPSDFGYVLGLDPSDPDRLWVVPEESGHMRSVCEGRLRVYETLDAGRSWTPRTEGLPGPHAYLSVLREALATDGLAPCGVHLGTSTGHLFTSPDGRSWRQVAAHLPRILSVTAAVLPA